jgi:acyl-coenzyme A synthetase/AMP-(fatty) acid ligase
MKEIIRQLAIKWQEEASKKNMSYKELLEWSNVFSFLAGKYGLKKEFKENGII